jgi:hypothetical protein
MENQIKKLKNADFIFSDEAALLRLKRKAHNSSFVLHAHTEDSIIELDADDLFHAVNLGKFWIGRNSVNYVCVKRMFKNGRLHKGCNWSTDTAEVAA